MSDNSRQPGADAPAAVVAIAEEHRVRLNQSKAELRRRWAIDNPGHMDVSKGYLVHPDPGNAGILTEEEVQRHLRFMLEEERPAARPTRSLDDLEF